MRFLEDIQSELSHLDGRLSYMLDLKDQIELKISETFRRMDEVREELNAHPDYEEHYERRDPETAVFSAMQGGTDGG
jgi:uncharacterized coiled-coil DUF342 family protein